jgi:cardiolipin synthase (CMP-forming)
VAETASTNRVLTIPNLVSFLRLLGVPLFWWVLLIEENIPLAGWLVFIIGWTDWIDGYLARRLDQVSELGKTLDPVADRLMIASAVVGGLIKGVLPAVIGWGLLARELLMAVIALILLVRKAGQLEVRRLGKVATFVLYGAVPAFYVAEGVFIPVVFSGIAWFFGVIGLAFYWYAAVQYLADARGRLAPVESPGEPEEA